MTAPRTPARTAGRVRAVPVLALVLVALAGCSGSPDADAPGGAAATITTAPDPGPAPVVPGLELPEPVDGLVRVDGGTDPLLFATRDAFGARSAVEVVTEESPDLRAVSRLCAGEVDVVDLPRALTAAEYDACRDNGLDVVTFRVAAEALVLAVDSDSDVGADCLSLDQVSAALGAGSTVTSWAELGSGLDDIPFGVVGPEPGLDAARFLGRALLGTSEPSVEDLREDFRYAGDEDETRRLVAGDPADRASLARLPAVTRLVERYRAELPAAEAEVEAARAEVDAAVVARDTAPDPATRDAAGARVRTALSDRSAAVVGLQGVAGALADAETELGEAQAAQDRLDETRGRLGVFSLGYHAAYDTRLRALELDTDPDPDRQDCRYPDDASVLSGGYPLARTLQLSVTSRSLERPEVRELLGFYLSQAPANARAVGAIPLPDAELVRQIGWLADDAMVPTFAPVGGGPVQELPGESGDLDPGTGGPDEAPAPGAAPVTPAVPTETAPPAGETPAEG